MLGVSVDGVVICTGACGAVTGALGMAGTSMLLIGDVGLDGLLIDFTHVFDVVCQTFDHTGLPYGSGQLLVCCWLI